MTIEPGGKKGKLVFKMGAAELELELDVRVEEGSPRRLSISAVKDLGPPGKFTNELTGFFVPSKPGEPEGDANPLVVRGSIVQTSENLPSPRRRNSPSTPPASASWSR